MKIVHLNDMPYDAAKKGDYENYVGIEEMSITYVQEPDCTEDRDGDYQRMTISVRDGGGGFFLHLKTEGWSIDDTDSIDEIINDFKSRLNYGKETESSST